MAKTTEEILKGGPGGRVDPKMVEAIRADAIKRGLAKRVIHIEYDMLTGGLNAQASNMDMVTHLGILDFYRTTILKNFTVGKPALGTPGQEGKTGVSEDAGAPKLTSESAVELCGHAYGKNGALDRPFYCNLAKGHDSHHREDPDLPSAVPETPAPAAPAPESAPQA